MSALVIQRPTGAAAREVAAAAEQQAVRDSLMAMREHLERALRAGQRAMDVARRHDRLGGGDAEREAAEFLLGIEGLVDTARNSCRRVLEGE